MAIEITLKQLNLVNDIRLKIKAKNLIDKMSHHLESVKNNKG